MRGLKNFLLVSTESSKEYILENVFPLVPNFCCLSVEDTIRDPQLIPSIKKISGKKLICLGQSAASHLQTSGISPSEYFTLDEFLLIGSRKHGHAKSFEWTKEFFADFLNAYFKPEKGSHFMGNQSLALSRYKDFNIKGDSLVAELFGVQ